MSYKYKGYKFRIYPTSEQRAALAKTFGCVRFMYNKMLADKIRYYKKTGRTMNNTAEQYKAVFAWLREADGSALVNAQLNLQKEFDRFLRSPPTGFPRFKSRKAYRQSYTTNCGYGNISVADGFIKLPEIGLIKCKQHRGLPAGCWLKSVTVSETAGEKYYASVLIKYVHKTREKTLRAFLGLDYSMRELYKDSNGNEPGYPRFYRQSEKKLGFEQRKLAKMVKGSNNRDKQRIRVAKLQERVSNQRKDFLHKQSRRIADGYDCVCIEDLDMNALSQAHSFGKSVSDNGWGMFTGFLQYKLAEEDKELVRVDRYFASSQICSCCGYRHELTKDLSVRAWDCPKCGVHHNRDENAAVNIRNEGMRLARLYQVQRCC